MAENVDFVIKVDDSQFQAAMNRAIDKVESAENAIGDLSKTTQKEIEKASKAASGAATEAATEAEAAAMRSLGAQKDLGQEMQKTAAKGNIFSRALNAVSQKLNEGKARLTGYLERLKAWRAGLQQTQDTSKIYNDTLQQTSSRANVFKQALDKMSGAVAAGREKITGYIERFRAWRTASKQTEAEVKDLGTTVEKASTKTNIFRRAIDSISKGVDGLKNKLSSVRDRFTAWGNGIEQASQSLEDAKIVTEEQGAVIAKLGRGLAAGRQVVNGFRIAINLLARGLGLLGKLIAGLAVGGFIAAIVGAVFVLGGLAVAASRASDKLNAFETAAAAAKGVVTVLKNRVTEFGKALEQYLSGEREEGIRRMGNAFKGLGQDIRDTTKEMIALAEETKRLEAGWMKYDERIAATKDTIEAFRDAAEDERKTTGQRIASIRQAGDIQFQNEEKLLELRRKNLEIAQREYFLNQADKVSTQNLSDAYIKLKEAEAEVNARRRADQRQINNLLDIQAQKIRDIRKEYEDLLKALGERTKAAELDLLPDAERIFKEMEFAQQAVKDFKKEIEDAFKALQKIDPKATLPESFAKDFEKLFAQIDADFKKAVDDYRKKTANESPFAELFDVDPDAIQQVLSEVLLPSALVADQGREFEKALEESFNRVEEAANRFRFRLKNQKTPFLEWKEQILSSLNITEEEANLIFQAVGGAINSFIESSMTLANAQLDYLRRVVDAYDEQIDALESKLDKERKLQEQGYANNASLYEAQLKDVQKKREEADAKALEQQKRIAKATLAINAAQQVSEYVLTVVRLLNQGAKLAGPVGLIAAIGGIALLARLVAQARATALANSEPPKFAAGGPVPAYYAPDRGRISGPSHNFGGRKIEVEGGEYVVRKSMAEKHLPLLDAINSGKISYNYTLPRQDRIFSIEPLLAALKDNRSRAESMRVEIQTRGDSAKETADQIRKDIDRVIQYMQTRPIRVLDKNGNEVIRWKEGNSTITQIKKG